MDIPAILTLDPSQLIAGPVGPQGEQGIQGPQGQQGEQGPAGPAGSGSVQGVVSLITYLDARHGAGNWTQRTGVGQGTDIGPALGDALDDLRATYGRGSVVIPPGTWLMTAPPSAAQYSGNFIDGLGSQASKIVFNAAAGSPFSFSGAGGYTGGGVRGIGLLLEDGYPSSTAQMIRLAGDATYQPDQMEFRDLYMSALGNSYWYDGLYAFGNARTSPQGIRVMDFSNVQVFRCRNTGVYLSNVVQCAMRNIGVYAGQGTGNNFYITGGGAALSNSNQIHIDGLAVAGELNMTNCTRWHVSGSVGSVGAAASANYGDLCVVKSGTFGGAFGANTRIVML